MKLLPGHSDVLEENLSLTDCHFTQHCQAPQGLSVSGLPFATFEVQLETDELSCAAQAAFAKAVQQEFARIMGSGSVTASEAAQEALHNVAAQTMASQKAR